MVRSYTRYTTLWYPWIPFNTLWYPLISSDILWHPLRSSDILWFLLIPSDTFRCLLMPSDTFWYLLQTEYRMHRVSGFIPSAKCSGLYHVMLIDNSLLCALHVIGLFVCYQYVCCMFRLLLSQVSAPLAISFDSRSKNINRKRPGILDARVGPGFWKPRVFRVWWREKFGILKYSLEISEVGMCRAELPGRAWIDTTLCILKHSGVDCFEHSTRALWSSWSTMEPFQTL